MIPGQVRYVGIYVVMGISLLGTTFVPGPLKLCTELIYSTQWMYLVFMGAADLVMILRVYAMWRQSKTILSILLFCFVVKAVVELVGIAVFDNPRTDARVIISQVLDYTTCTEVLSMLSPYLKFTLISTFLFDVLLLILALIPAVKDSMAMYRETKLWQPNRYMSLIVREGVFYIFLNFFNTIAVIVSQVHTGTYPPIWVVVFGIFGVVSLYPAIPRFVLSIRELYEKESRGHSEGIDSGFGVSLHTWSYSGRETIASIAFASGLSLSGEGDEEMQLEQVKGNEG